jgi:hypothetical protein
VLLFSKKHLALKRLMGIRFEKVFAVCVFVCVCTTYVNVVPKRKQLKINWLRTKRSTKPFVTEHQLSGFDTVVCGRFSNWFGFGARREFFHG